MCYRSAFFSVPKDGPDTVYQNAAPAKPFFQVDSAVYDLYRGEMKPLPGLIKGHSFIFVMYYSAWSAACMSAQEEFSKAAKIMKTRVIIDFQLCTIVLSSLRMVSAYCTSFFTCLGAFRSS